MNQSRQAMYGFGQDEMDGDKEMGRRGEKETGRLGDKGMGRGFAIDF